MKKAQLIVLELNEINIDLLRRYADDGKLPNFQRLFRDHGLCRTLSESDHANANPWIQWVTAHTGLDLAEHGVFRMSDMSQHRHEQVWEALEARGCSVAALAPFNANNNCKQAAFFIPDPWTPTPVAGPWGMRQLYHALVQVADDYANERIALSSILRIIAGGLSNLHWPSLGKYLRDSFDYFLRGRRWARALVCDRLLVDCFVRQWQHSRPDFSTICLNAGAHLQHHYMLSSPYSSGERKNPPGYVPPGVDPVGDAYALYDELLGRVQATGARVMLVTGLAQVEHERESYYYRMNHHEQVLDALVIGYQAIHPLMTEDFILSCATAEDALASQRQLEATVVEGDASLFYVDNADVQVRRTITSEQIFYVDNRGNDLYVQLKPTRQPLPEPVTVRCGSKRLPHFEREVAFAQLKNGHHVGTGYFSDTGLSAEQLPVTLPLRELRARMEAAVLPEPAATTQPLPRAMRRVEQTAGQNAVAA